MPHDYYPTADPEQEPEHEKPRHGFENLTSGDILVALLEKQVVPVDDPNYPDDPRKIWSCERQFRTMNGDQLKATGMLNYIEIAGNKPSIVWIWDVAVQRPSEPTTLRLHIYEDIKMPEKGDLKRGRVDNYRVNRLDGDEPGEIGESDALALIATVATMRPTTATQYELGNPGDEEPADLQII